MNMSNGFVEFRELSKTSQKIQDKLKGARDEAAFAALAAKVGAEEGYQFSAQDVLVWNKRQMDSLSDEQLSAVSGGLRIQFGSPEELWYRIFYA
jgi:ATPase subunit of ABC transporter with duplicated ATPase domains